MVATSSLRHAPASPVLLLVALSRPLHAAAADPFAALRAEESVPGASSAPHAPAPSPSATSLAPAGPPAIAQDPPGAAAPVAAADPGALSPSGLSADLRATVELVVLGGASPRGLAEHSALGLGLDVYAPIVDRTGTLGAGNLQLRALFDPRLQPRVEVHNAYLERRLWLGRLVLRAGHFQLPFNLEGTELDTHTTVLKLSNDRALGLKHDWGVGAHGQLGVVDYEVAASLGSGMDLPRARGLGLLSGRLGWRAPGQWLGLGASAAAGQWVPAGHALDPHGHAPPDPAWGWRGGLDSTLQFLWFTVLGEVALGFDGARPVAVGLGRLQFESSDRWWQLAAQVSRGSVLGVDASFARAELDAGLRQAWLARDAFVRFNLAAERAGARATTVAMVMFYLPLEVERWRQ